MQKSAIEEIKQLKAQIEGITGQACAEAIAAAREAIEVFRELGLDNDTMLKDLGVRARSAPMAPKTKDGETGPKDEPCPICIFPNGPFSQRKNAPRPV